MIQAQRKRESAPRRSSASWDLVERGFASVGVRLDGPNPWDLQILDERFADRLVSQGKLGLGESYMDGWWECEQIDEFILRVLDRRLLKQIKLDWRVAATVLRLKLLNLQTPKGARQIAAAHYDLGNEFYEKMLGPTMTYSCGYWRDAKTLDEAQDRKHDL